MTSLQPTTRRETSQRTRRALLAGVLGGLGTWAAAAVTRLQPAEAAAGDPIRMGRINRPAGTSTQLETNSSKPGFWVRQSGGGHALRAEVTTGRALMAVAGANGAAIWAKSAGEFAINAQATDIQGIAVRGHSPNYVGVYGSGRIGVSGIASETGIVASGGQYAATLLGKVLVNGVQEMVVQPEPDVANANQLRLYARDDGFGKVQLCVRFPTGAVQVLATEA